ncbi:beta-hexosaminidase precursor [Melioribacter roseus P3M-2]|jgi:hexosaminidase|uniref:beta-N-acetylhexosaminidase n=1 Tax=Melioribacter roseus (strain DSM 23840 / JCM 17771 / VKM B-2668 / P3M-2) TaxID=1191523 RepID=I7A4K7_MELRP|nr:family 20 glycosylhydrolase [Melioribacter roseus]AFN74826.1 beta-hexosaminidase precursor [Melioribacter roseus P3M-2]
MKFSAVFLFGILFTIAPKFYAQSGTLQSLIPKPEKIIPSEGKFTFDNKITVKSTSGKLASYFKNKIFELTGIKLMNDSSAKIKTIIFESGVLPNESDKEAYNLEITQSTITISANTDEGIFRGIQTVFQLIPPEIKKSRNGKPFVLPACKIEDNPRFQWRGLNLDCSRHFMSKDFIKRYIDILAYFKFNTLHWHFTDDQGWRIEIKKYPKLTQIGAWRKEADGSLYGGYYSQEDIKEIVEYAKSRYINIVPEIEMPGHCLASLASYPENSCTGGPFEVTNMWGVMKDVYCAGRDSTFIFLQNILDEVIDLFPGKYIHIGGDEVPKDRWKECPRCQERIKTEGLKDEKELQSYFIKRIVNYLESKGKTAIGWDEILEGGLAPGVIVQSWQGHDGAIAAARQKHYTICSPTSHTYLNYDPDNLDLKIAYSFEPVPVELNEEEAVYVIGSEANLWTEHCPQEKVDSQLFPRILALSEVFWTTGSKDYDEFYSRLKNKYEDLTSLGIKYGRESKLITYKVEHNTDPQQYIVTFDIHQEGVNLRYTLDGTTPTYKSEIYTQPIVVNNTSKLVAAAFRDTFFLNKKINFDFIFHKAVGSDIKIINEYSLHYRANGDNSLVDGIRGTDDFHDGMWQGYQGVDFEAVIDLGSEKEISRVVPRFILNSNSWVFLPKKVVISISKDGSKFSDEKVIANDVPQKNSEIIIKEFGADFIASKARYIKVFAESIKVCPEWHPGAGHKAWLFIDEIVVE